MRDVLRSGEQTSTCFLISRNFRAPVPRICTCRIRREKNHVETQVTRLTWQNNVGSLAAYRSRCIFHLSSPLMVSRLPAVSLSTRKTRITWHTSFVHIMLGRTRTYPLLNLIQYNMSPSLTPLSRRREGPVKPGGWLFKTVPISIHRETSSYYDRSNTDWSGQVFYSCGVPVSRDGYRRWSFFIVIKIIYP